jgi:hypothetical protein
MKRNHATKLLVVVSFLVLLVAATNSVVARPEWTGECGGSGCHAPSSTLTVTTNTTVEAETNVTFTLQIDAGDDVDYVSIKGGWADNDYFSFSEVLIQDQSADDTNAAEGEIFAEVSFTPLTNGTYTLRIWAVSVAHLSESFDVTITVTGDPGELPPPPVDLYGIWTTMMIWVPIATGAILLILGYLALKRK